MSFELTCDWCSWSEEYDSPAVATAEGWFLFTREDDGEVFCFCCPACWMSWM